MKKIIVTGGAGYIGSHTIIELVKSGYFPIIIDNLCNSSINNIQGIEQIIGKKFRWHNIDCTDKLKMQKIFLEENNIEGVIHFAAYKSVEESVKKPEKYHNNNVGSLNVVLECMKEKNVQKIIFSSSCTVYGMPDIFPVDESAPFKKAESPYGETKQICEEVLLSNPCNSISLRYFNPIGSHNSTLIGDCSADKASNLVPIITETVIGRRKEITIFGDDYNTPDGTCIRDYIHVVDLAKSHVLALNFILKKSGKHVFNIGTGNGVSVLEAIKTFEKANDLKVNYSIGKRRSGDIEKIYANTKLAKQKLNWEPIETLKNAMISAWNWEKTRNRDV